MEKKELILKSISVIEAIENNDLEKVKILIDDLNYNLEQKEINEGVTYYSSEFIPFNQLINSEKSLNETLLYVVSNLNGIYGGRENIEWRVKTLLLLNSQDRNNKIENFIIDFIENNSTIEDYKMSMLIQMCIIIDRYDLLKQIKTKFENS